jgi:hypothetical protein
MVYSTTHCHCYEHPEVEGVVVHDDRYRDALIDHISNLERCVEAGLRLEEGSGMECGWMSINLARLPDGRLTHEEPDFRSMPIRWVRRLDRTFEHLRVQTKLMESLGLDEFDFASLAKAGVVGRDCMQPGPLRLCREEPEQANDSGWVLEPIPPRLDYTADPEGSLLFQSLYETALVRPEIVPFMAMPVGSDVRIAADGALTICLHDRALRLKLGSNLRDYLPLDVDEI